MIQRHTRHPGTPRSAAPWNRPIFVPDDKPAPPGFMRFNYNGNEEIRPYQVCCHCKCRVLLNPDRRREREHCAAHNHYVCDDPRCKKCPLVCEATP